MSKMSTCLWFDHGQARAAAEFYVSVFPDSHIGTALESPTDNPSTKRGEEITVEFTVLGQSFVGLNGGPNFGPMRQSAFRFSPTPRRKPTATGTRSSEVAALKACAAGARIAGAFRGRSVPAR